MIGVGLGLRITGKAGMGSRAIIIPAMKIRGAGMGQMRDIGVGIDTSRVGEHGAGIGTITMTTTIKPEAVQTC